MFCNSKKTENVDVELVEHLLFIQILDGGNKAVSGIVEKKIKPLYAAEGIFYAFRIGYIHI